MAPLSIVRSNGATGRLQYLPSDTSQDKGRKRRRGQEKEGGGELVGRIFVSMCVHIRSNARRGLPSFIDHASSLSIFHREYIFESNNNNNNEMGKEYWS